MTGCPASGAGTGEPRGSCEAGGDPQTLHGKKGSSLPLSLQFQGDNPNTSRGTSCKGLRVRRGFLQSPRPVQRRARLRGDPCPPSKAAQRGRLPTRPRHAACLGPASKEQLKKTKSDEVAQVRWRRRREAAPCQLPPSPPRSEMAQKPRPVPAATRPRGAAAAVLLWRKLRLLLQSISHPITALFFF